MNARLVSLQDEPSRQQAQSAWWRFVERQLPMVVICLLVATLVGVVLAPFVLVTVPSGYVGVLWKRFGSGTVLDPRQLRDEGMRFILPWNRLFLYDLRLQSATETYNAISRDGISLTATINIRYRLKRESVPQLHQTIGPNYVKALVSPEVGNRMREVIAEYTAEDVYSTKRTEIQGKIRQRAEAMLGEKMMVGGEGVEDENASPYHVPLYAMLNLIDTLILGIELPSAVVTAINRKIEQYYISEEYKFRVAREIRESERKKIEAEGISEFQHIVSQGISPSYLRWRGIEATLQLAQSSNSKIVMIGGGQNVPIILGNLDTAPQPPASQGAETASKERPTAATTTRPAEQLPADTLPKPSEKVPSTTTRSAGQPPADTLLKPSEKTPSTQPPEAQRAISFPISWSDVKAWFARLAVELSSSSAENPPANPAPQAPPQAPQQTPAAETPANGRARPEQTSPPDSAPAAGWRRSMGDGMRMPSPNAPPGGPPPPDAEGRNGRERF
jgi:regulator of protease activity HflC (stomatin/prohibitin superfamily)